MQGNKRVDLIINGAQLALIYDHLALHLNVKLSVIADWKKDWHSSNLISLILLDKSVDFWAVATYAEGHLHEMDSDLTFFPRYMCGLDVASSLRIMRTSATAVFPPEVGAQ
jgi:hypothetical protein